MLEWLEYDQMNLFTLGEGLLSLKETIKKAADERDLQWFLSLTDHSVTTLIRNCHRFNSTIYGKYKSQIQEVNSCIHLLMYDISSCIPFRQIEYWTA